MKRKIVIYALKALSVLMTVPCYAQEDQNIEVEPSSEVFLEEYTDKFQEAFFEALKQKGIQNYDRAANLLLECKQMDPENTVVDHELARVYLLEKQFSYAKAHAIEAVASEPENYWYLNTLLEILDGSSETVGGIKNSIPYENQLLQKNLALIYFNTAKYSQALSVLDNLKGVEFAKRLERKIKDSLSVMENPGKQPLTPRSEDVATDDPLQGYKEDLEQLLAEKEFQTTAELAKEAKEAFPLQPFFYYAEGVALVKLDKYKEAIGALEEGLGLLIDDTPLENKFYKELSTAYTALGNPSKANMYLNKIKTGS